MLIALNLLHPHSIPWQRKMHIDLSTEEMLAKISMIMADYEIAMGHNDYLFLERTFGEGLGKYVDRLRSIGFTGKGKVLDAGCGYGQWSLALAEMNETIESCDITPSRVQFLETLAVHLNVTNLTVKVSTINAMPYSDNYFDAVFCYGVIFLTPWHQSLVELIRVLKPGGSLYVNANGLGWYMFLWCEEHNKANDYDPKAITAKCLSDTLAYDRLGIYKPGMNLIIEPAAMIKTLSMLGFSCVQLGSEGSLYSPTSIHRPQPFFIGSFGGCTAVFEILAQKPLSCIKHHESMGIK